MSSSSSSLIKPSSDKKRPAPAFTVSNNLRKNPLVVVIKKKPRKRPKLQDNSSCKPGIPNLTKALTEAPASPSNEGDNDDILFPPLEDAIPCDTLLAVQSLKTQPHLGLPIPLMASSETISSVLESQIYPLLQQQNDNDDHESLGMITRELTDLFRQNTLRRLTSISTGATAATDVTVLITTHDYLRGVWDAHDAGVDHQHDDAAAGSRPEIIMRNVKQAYVQWLTDNLHRWTGRVVTTSQFQETWHQHPPPNSATLHYQTTISLSKALEYFQKLQILMANHHHGSRNETTYQLWLPQWGTVLAALKTAQTKFLQKLRQTYQKELSEHSFLQQPYYNKISTRLLLQWMQDIGLVQLVPKPFGNFIKLVVIPKKKDAANKRR